MSFNREHDEKNGIIKDTYSGKLAVDEVREQLATASELMDASTEEIAFIGVLTGVENAFVLLQLLSSKEVRAFNENPNRGPTAIVIDKNMYLLSNVAHKLNSFIALFNRDDMKIQIFNDIVSAEEYIQETKNK